MTRARDSDPLPTDPQRKALCEMLAAALVEIRLLAGGGSGVDARQACDLADAFHNLPREMYGWGSWSVAEFRRTLGRYQRKYPGGPDYVKMLDAIFIS